MSALADIENGLITRLEGLTHLGNPAFRVVRGLMISGNEKFPRAVLRETKPAAYVSFRSIFIDETLQSTIRFFSAASISIRTGLMSLFFRWTGPGLSIRMT